MDERQIQEIMIDFSRYRALVDTRPTAPGVSISGGCYWADRYAWSRVKGVKVHYDEHFHPRKIELLKLGITYRLQAV